MGLAQIPFIINFCFSWKYGRKVSDNPWEATTLEWAAPSPPPHGNFTQADRRLSRPLRIQRAGPSDRLHPPDRAAHVDQAGPYFRPASPRTKTPSASRPSLKLLSWKFLTHSRRVPIPASITASSASGSSSPPKSCSSARSSPPIFSCVSARRTAPGPTTSRTSPLGLTNTCILITSSITMVWAWVALKERKFNTYRVCSSPHHPLRCRLSLHQGLEYHRKFNHLGVIIKDDAIEKYRPELRQDERFHQLDSLAACL